MAFQIVDDILDVVATDAELGKPAGHDLVEGVYTLPVLRALAGRRAALKGLLGRPVEGDELALRALIRCVSRRRAPRHAAPSTARAVARTPWRAISSLVDGLVAADGSGGAAASAARDGCSPPRRCRV